MDIVSLVIGTMLAVIGYLINDKLSGIKDVLKELKTEVSRLNEMYHDHETRIQKLEDND